MKLLKYIPFIFIFFLAIFVFLTNLEGQDYSLDEPDTVIVAKTISMYGFPSPWDGENLTSGANGKDFTVINGYYFWTWHPWLQHYIAFAGMNIFGNNVGEIRILFALFGVMTVLITFCIAQYLYKNKLISTLLSVQLIFLLPFFLYVRQIRYYSLSAFFAIIIFALLLKLHNNEWNKKLTIVLFFSLFFLFMSNYIIWISSLIPIMIYAFFKKNKSVFIVSIITILFASFWLYFFKPIGGNIFLQTPKLFETGINTIKYLSYLNHFILPLIFLIPVFFLKKKRKYVILFSIWISTKLFFYSFFQIPHGRYLVDLFPIIILLYGMLYAFCLEKKQYFLFFLVFCGSAYIPISQNWGKTYTIELTKKYQSMMPQIGNYLKKESKPGDLFWSNSYRWYIYEYSHVPHISPLCDMNTNKIQGPINTINTKNIRWFIFFQHDDRLMQNISDDPCFDKKDQEKLKKEYTKKMFPLKENTYLINDPDIVNRNFPPNKTPYDTIIIYERKK